MSGPCAGRASSCLAALGTGTWDAAAADVTWRFDAPRCCGFGQVGPERAADLLGGKRIVFVGDSHSRRHMWAVVDAVGGAARAVRRRPGQAVPDSHRDFDEKAVRLNDTLYDSQRAYHAGQTVLLNVRTGKWQLLDPTSLCGVDRRQWLADFRLINALARGQPEPWAAMRGAQFRLRLTVSPRTARSGGAYNETVGAAWARALRHARGGSERHRAARRGAPLGGTNAFGERVRKAVEALARESLRGWGCQKARMQECTFDGAIQRNCARRLNVLLDSTPDSTPSP